MIAALVTPMLAFAASAAVVVVAGALLARQADTIAEITGLGRMWVGVVLLASATSLPELFIDVSAVRAGNSNLAAGDLFGSSMANMLILVAVDLVLRREPIFRHARSNHVLTAALAILLNALAAIMLVSAARPTVGWVDSGSVLLVLVYLVGMRTIWRKLKRDGLMADGQTATARPAPDRASLRRPVALFALGAVALMVAAPSLARSAHQIASISGLGDSFVGTLLLGLTTSLPELVASMAALRTGAIDLAVGNLLSSNGINMTIFAAMDVANGPTSIFVGLSTDHVLAALLAITLMSLGVGAIVYRPERRWSLLEPTSATIAVAYVVAILLLYHASLAP